MIFQIFTFVMKHLLLRFGVSHLFQDTAELKKVITAQNKLISEKDKKIIELQEMILNAGSRV